jgi:hypothetical protein
VTALIVLGSLAALYVLIWIAGYRHQSGRRRAEDRARKGVRR